MHQLASTSVPVRAKSAVRARRGTALLAAIGSIGALALSMTVHADNQDTIDYREHVMKTLAAQANAISLIVQNKVPADDASNLTTNLKILALTASTAKAAFKDNVPGGEAKPAVWSNWADFSKRMDELAANTADLEKAGDGGASAVAAKLQSALTCKGCHDQYREQKKK